MPPNKMCCAGREVQTYALCKEGVLQQIYLSGMDCCSLWWSEVVKLQCVQLWLILRNAWCASMHFLATKRFRHTVYISHIYVYLSCIDANVNPISARMVHRSFLCCILDWLHRNLFMFIVGFLWCAEIARICPTAEETGNREGTIFFAWHVHSSQPSYQTWPEFDLMFSIWNICWQIIGIKDRHWNEAKVFSVHFEFFFTLGISWWFLQYPTPQVWA